MTLTDAQIEIRRSRVGSSEIAALIPPMADGTVVHPHGKGPFDVFASKTGSQKPQSAEQRWGQLVEPAILQMHCETQGLEILPHPGTVIHPRYPWLCATPDTIVRAQDGKRRLVEAKNVGRWMAHMWGAEGSGEVPMGYAAQVQVTLDTLISAGLVDDENADLIASIGGMPPAVYLIDRRPPMFERLAAIAKRFVDNHLATGVPPEQGWDCDAAEAWLRKKYPNASQPMQVATAEDLRLARQLSYARKRKKRWTDAEAEAKNRLRARIGSAEGIAGIATNRTNADGTRVLRFAKEWSAA